MVGSSRVVVFRADVRTEGIQSMMFVRRRVHIMTVIGGIRAQRMMGPLRAYQASRAHGCLKRHGEHQYDQKDSAQRRHSFILPDARSGSLEGPGQASMPIPGRSGQPRSD